MADRRNPKGPEAHEPDSIHDTQASLPILSSEARPKAHELASGADTMLSGPNPEEDLHAELHQRLSALETALVEVQARVRLLEKQTSSHRTLVYWFLALSFFALLAVTWQLISRSR